MSYSLSATEDTSATIAQTLQRAKCLVIKIGSALLLDAKGALNRDWMATLAADIKTAQGNGQSVILVSSGAVGLGAGGAQIADMTLEEKQACAAIGQTALVQGWRDALHLHEIEVAQILLTVEDTEQRRRYLNARNTLRVLLERGIVPIINENDTVATQELRYGDNDRLAARVAGMVGADCLLLLSDIDGLYAHPPDAENRLDATQHIGAVREITPQVLAMAGDVRSRYGRGGMKTKLEAARIAVAAGCAMVLGSGRIAYPLTALVEKADGVRATLFHAKKTSRDAREIWIASNLQSKGAVRIDAGAIQALQAGGSLLPIGVCAVDGAFERGDNIAICAPDGKEIGRGLVAYDSDSATQIMGRKSSEIEEILGYAGRGALIHRDDMVITQAPETEETDDE